MRRAWSVALLVLAMADASATPLDAVLEVRGPANFIGQGRVDATWSGSLFDARLGHVGEIGEFSIVGQATLMTYQYVIEESDPDSPTGYGYHQVLAREESQSLGQIAGTLTVPARGPHIGVRALPNDPIHLSVADSFNVSAPQDLHQMLAADNDPQPYDKSEASYPTTGAMLTAANITWPPDYSGRLFITDAQVVIGEQSIDTRWVSQAGEVPGLASATSLETKVLLVDGRVAPTGVDGRWTTLVTNMAGRLDGDLALQNARGTAILNGSAAEGIALFQAVGTMEMAADFTQSHSSWSVKGDVAFAALDARVVAGARWGWLPEAAAGLGIVAGLLVLAKLLLAGLNISEPTSNPKRLEILRLVSQNPGITLPQIARGAGVARATARHHIRILSRGNLLSQRLIGNASSFTLNSATFDFKGPGSAPVLAGEALGKFAHPVRTAIRKALESLGEASYAEMRRFWEEAGQKPASRKLVSYHCGLLLSDGLLQRRLDGQGRAKWSLAIDFRTVLAHQRQAYVRQGKFGEILRVLSRHLLEEKGLLERLKAEGATLAVKDLRKALLLLEATGYIERTPDGIRVLEEAVSTRRSSARTQNAAEPTRPATASS